MEVLKLKDNIIGEFVKFSNGIVEIKIPLEFGPRILGFNIVGMENLFYIDEEKRPLGDKIDLYKGDIIRLYGGHRLWISPEINPRCYHPDNEKVTVEEIENGVKITGAIEKYNGIQKSIRLSLDKEKPIVYLEQIIKNLSNWDIEFAPWGITMFDAGGKCVMPMNKTETGLLPNKFFSFWDYSDLNDERLQLGKDFIVLEQNSLKESPFKLGYSNESGWAGYFNKNQLFLKFFEYDPNVIYPDNGCNFETYTNQHMLESESLGFIRKVAPGEEVVHKERWEIYKEDFIFEKDENLIKKIINKYL